MQVTQNTVIKLVLAHWLNNYTLKAEYYNSLHDPEHRQNHGHSAGEKAYFASEDLEKAQRDFKDFNYWIDNGVLQPAEVLQMICKIELTTAIKDTIREARREAAKVDTLKSLWLDRIREAITAKNILDSIAPEYKVFNLKAF